MPKPAPSKPLFTTKPYSAPQTRVNKGGRPPKNPPTSTSRPAQSESLLTGKPYGAPETKVDKHGRPPKTAPTKTPLALWSHLEGDVPPYSVGPCNFVCKECGALHWAGERPACKRWCSSSLAAATGGENGGSLGYGLAGRKNGGEQRGLERGRCNLK
ncbi:hypothetical protein L198_07081 [Cryptococcus wingfieldii CBS 7118]|uniref:Uncharacterized protein n=1 Tax=Cryptococcus wingfieldii CBS 7118 TaxID=1295528 RepID=A0A1E3IET8_9TREE|nr:hypothetical protein L198_07081 [Cryptococcus wingfieldii CBS 7118]ODN87079.1 hypothetical protein L198_07081 [Cryptococcus wingfieldii CBS 7118]